MASFVHSTHSEGAGVKWNVRFAPLPHGLLVHPNFSRLSGGSVKLLLSLMADFAGKNNGHLTATSSRLNRYGFNSKDSIAKGVSQLIALGFIVRARTSVFRNPALYAITWLPIDEPLPGMKYDQGIVPGTVSLDLWRHANPNTMLAAA